MPFCHISNDISLHYITNTPKGDASDLDPSKPTILLLPPHFTAVPWLREQFRDARLSGHYNLIAFDLPNMGQTRAPLSPERDAWVDATDIGVAHEKLQIPPCHVFATAMASCVDALSFAIVFPAKCLSLFLCSAPRQDGDDPEWVIQGYRDLLDAWCFPPDLETYERGCMELSRFLFNEQVAPELEDELIAWLQIHYPPTVRSLVLCHGLSALNRPRFSDKELHAIQVPTLFVQGDKDIAHPPAEAQKISEKIPNSKVFTVKGGPGFMTVIPEYASIVNRVYCQFLSGLTHHPQDCQPSQPDPDGICEAALKRLAAFADQPSIAQRDPIRTLSFSRLSPEVIGKNIELFEKFSRGEKDVFNPLNEHGQPKRKFSERNKEQWKAKTFESMKHRMAAEAEIVKVVESSSVSTQEG